MLLLSLLENLVFKSILRTKRNPMDYLFQSLKWYNALIKSWVTYFPYLSLALSFPGFNTISILFEKQNKTKHMYNLFWANSFAFSSHWLEIVVVHKDMLPKVKFKLLSITFLNSGFLYKSHMHL